MSFYRCYPGGAIIKSVTQAFLLILTFLLILSCGPSADELVIMMVDEGMYMSAGVGYAGEMPEQYKRFLALSDKVDKAYFEKLLSHESPVIRMYAIDALVDKYGDYINAFEFAQEMIRDTEATSSMFGCIVSSTMVGDYAISRVSDRLEEHEIRSLTEIAVTERLDLYFTYRQLSSGEIIPHLYEHVKEWALEGYDPAVLYLARYGRPGDWNIVSKLKHRNEHMYLKALQLLRVDDVKAELQEYLTKILPKDTYSNSWKEFYKTLASFKDQFSVEQFSRLFSREVNSGIKEYHHRFAFAALWEYRNDLYDDLLLRLWRESGIIEPDVLSYLFEKRQDSAIPLIEVSLQKLNSYYSYPSLIPLLYKLGLESGLDANGYLEKQLGRLNVHVFKACIPIMHMYWTPEIKEQLLKRLAYESNIHIYLPAYALLIKKEGTVIIPQLQTIYDQVREKYRGGSSSAVERLLAGEDVPHILEEYNFPGSG